MQADEKFRIGTLIEKANDSLGVAEELMESERYEEAVLSCYHAVFFTLRAFLTKNHIALQRTSESADVFKKEFVLSGKVDPSLYEDIMTVIRASGLEPGAPLFTADAESTRDIFRHADRFYCNLSERI